jgi:hypothetical protein
LAEGPRYARVAILRRDLQAVDALQDLLLAHSLAGIRVDVGEALLLAPHPLYLRLE